MKPRVKLHRFEPISTESQPHAASIVAAAEFHGGAVTAHHLQSWFSVACCIARINRALDRAGWRRERNAEGVIVWVGP